MHPRSEKIAGSTAALLKILIACLPLLFLAPAIPSCKRSPADQPTPQPPEEPGELLPISEESGLHLIYTVNDPRAATLGTRRSAHVLIAEPDGSRREVLFSYPGFVFHTVPSPDGTHIAFVGSTLGEAGLEERHLFLYDLDTARYSDVSSPGFYSRLVETAPLFSTDSRWVLFISRRSEDSNIFSLFKCDVSTGRIAGLYTDPIEDVPLGLMPDGNQCIAVRRVAGIPSSFEYISVDIETGAATVLHRFNNVTKVGPAHVGRDATTIYCDIKPSDEGGGYPGGIPSRDALRIDLAQDTEHTICSPQTVTYVYQVFTDADGNERLLLRRQEIIEGEDTPMSRIAVSNTDGSDFHYLTDTTARSYLLPPPSNIPPLSPDASLLFFYRQDPVYEHEDIWVMKSDGTDPVNISNTAGYNEGSAGWIVIP